VKRVAIAAGGTGGHFYPGLVVAQALKARGWEPLLIVRSGDPALATLEKEGLAALPVDLRGLPRRPGPELFSFARKLAGSMGTLSRALRAFRPDLALGMGGYLTFPLIFAAWRRGVPRAVHESNAVLGLANAAAAKLGADLFWGLPPEDPAARGAVVGTPVRPALWIRRGAAESRRALGLADRPTLLVFGGSQGAQGLNAALPRALRSLPEVQVLHMAGKGKAEAAAAAYRAEGIAADVREYLDDMASAYGAADLVVCRSGASTLAELSAQRAPAVLVPYPHAAADHQNANARVFERAGASVRLLEAELDAKLGSVLADLLKSDGAEERRSGMSRAYERLGLPAAAATIDGFAASLEALSSR
jgi:UDP-N-acetylglucosamine--N-acetylmuramyl-(pentapeptide) pyrophosphoryl-undecaprenol N-acetylglucosamine transferase